MKEQSNTAEQQCNKQSVNSCFSARCKIDGKEYTSEQICAAFGLTHNAGTYQAAILNMAFKGANIEHLK